jgi:hypothetical protein
MGQWLPQLKECVMNYVLRGLDKEGNVLYYTGRAGMDWLSFDRSNAFCYPVKELAQERAKRFNKMEPVHGYWFIVQELEEVS